MTTTGQSLAPLGYALIGAGRFGQFCLENYRTMEQIQPVAIADVDTRAAAAAAKRLGVSACANIDQLLGREDVDLVHIATPPRTHRELTLKALRAGKHVLCEKPLAIRLEDAGEMIALARERKRVLAVNLIMRYNPLCQAVKRLIDDRLLGLPLHGFFENYAKDEPLPPSHWFWNRQVSGGIFIEHGVHFFDLFHWWLGDDHVLAAQQGRRPGTDLIEQVGATVRYGESALVNFFHSFTQAERMDRQEMRLVFERGSVRLFEWVPTIIEIDALADNRTHAAIAALFPDATTTTVATYAGDQRQVTSRHQPYQVDGRFNIQATVGMDKPALYGHILRSLLTDQVAAIRDPDHARLITEADGYHSLASAIAADKLARRG